MIYVGQFPDGDRISTIRSHVLAQVNPRRAAAASVTAAEKRWAAQAAGRAIATWFGGDAPLRQFAVNLRDTDHLLRHAAAIQGLDSDLSLLFGRWRHLPYWIESIWVPGEAAIPPCLCDHAGEGPFFIGSAASLACELDEIATASPQALKEMASSTGMAQETNGAAVQIASVRLRHVWRCYRDAVSLSLESGLPLWTAL